MADGSTLVLVPHKAESAVKDSEGQTIILTYATKNEVQRALTDGSVTKVGVNTVGGANRPIYLLNGVPTVADNVVSLDTEQTITGKKTFTRGTETDLIFLKSSIPHTSTADRSRNIVFVDVDGQAVGRVGNLIGGNVGRFGTRLIAYDPATGDSSILGVYIDKTTGAKYGEVPPVPANAPSNAIVNKAYVSATDGTTNNLVHTIGEEHIDGTKWFDGLNMFKSMVQGYHNLVRVAGTGWRKIYTGTLEFNHHNVILAVMPRRIGFGMGILSMGGHNSTQPVVNWMCGNIISTHRGDFAITYESESQVATIWQLATGTVDGYCTCILAHSWNGNCYNNPWTMSEDNTVYTLTENGYTDSEGVEHIFKYFVRSE